MAQVALAHYTLGARNILSTGHVMLLSIETSIYNVTVILSLLYICFIISYKNARQIRLNF
jgi:hypothetical protein